MKRGLQTFFLLACMSRSALCLPTNVGPHGGVSKSLAVAANDVYVVNARSGVFRSTNGGPWMLSFDSLTRGITVLRVVADPSTSIVYAATTGGLFATEAGDRWQLLREGAVSDVTVAASRIYVVTANGLSTSADGGRTWSPASGPVPDVLTNPRIIRLDPSGQRLYAAAGAELYVLDDQKQEWKILGPRQITAIAFDDAVYAGGSEGVFRCTSRCELIAREAVVDLAIWRHELFAATARGVVKINSVGEQARLTDVPALSLASAQDQLWAGTTTGVLHSIDGIHWPAFNDGLTNVRIASLALSSGKLIAATRGKSLLMRNAGMWSEADIGLPAHPPALPLASVVRCNEATCYVSLPGDGLFRSTDGGTSWKLVLSQPVSDIAVSGAEVFASAGSALFRSADGTNWLSTGGASSCVAAQGARVASASGTEIAVSEDSGKTWTGGSIPAVAVRLGFAGSLLIAGTLDGVFTSADQGHSWKSAALPSAGAGWRCMEVAGNVVYLAMRADDAESDARSGVYATSEGLIWKWIPLTDLLPPDITAMAADSTVLYVGTNGGSILTIPVTTRRRAVGGTDRRDAVGIGAARAPTLRSP
ncbi:MAG: hypothetical protein ABIP63_01835 [Thermoanaerobaculia bacterium]